MCLERYEDWAAGVLQDKLQLPAKAFSYLTSHGSLTWSTSNSSRS